MNHQLIEYVLVDAPVVDRCLGCCFYAQAQGCTDIEELGCSSTKLYAVVPAGFSKEQKEEANHA